MEVTSEGSGFNTVLLMHDQRRKAYERGSPGSGKEEEEGEENKNGGRKKRGREDPASAKNFLLATDELTFQQELASLKILYSTPLPLERLKWNSRVGKRGLPLSFHGNNSESRVVPLSYLNQHVVNKIIWCWIINMSDERKARPGGGRDVHSASEENSSQMGLGGRRPELITVPLICGVWCPQRGSHIATDQGLDLGSAKKTCDLEPCLALSGPHILFKLCDEDTHTSHVLCAWTTKWPKNGEAPGMWTQHDWYSHHVDSFFLSREKVFFHLFNY